jgi:transposase-like protein
MGKKDGERRAYPEEIKAEAAAPARKRGKPARQVAADLGIDEHLPHRRIRRARAAAGAVSPAFPGRGWSRGQELARPRKENNALRTAA